MKRILTIWSLLMVMITPLAAIGQWKAYMAYHHITDIEPAGKLVYVLSSNDLFSYNVNDNSVTIYNKVNSLSDSYIDFIAWNNTVKKLIIIYNNYNIDLLDMNDHVENICDYHNKSLLTSKTVYNITINGNDAYLSTASGILKINMKNAEISDTYYFGEAVNDVTLQNNNIYALTVNGVVYQGSRNNNLTDPASWTTTTDYPAFTDDNDITISKDNGYQEYIVYDPFNKCYWSNQSDGKLQQYTLSDEGIKTVLASNINPEGPKYNYFHSMIFENNQLYSTGGYWYSLNEHHRPGTVQVLKENGEWIIYEDELHLLPQVKGSYDDIQNIAVDPLDKDHVFVGGGGSGIFEFQNGKFIKQYTHGDGISPINTVYQDNGVYNMDYVRVDGLIYDHEGNLWMLNSLSTNSLIEYTVNKEWKTINLDEFFWSEYGFSLPTMTASFFDKRNLLWFSNNNHNNVALLCFNPNTLEVKKYTNITNQDGTSYHLYQINEITEDLDGNIWISTDVGPFYLTPEEIQNKGDVFTQFKVPRNDGSNYADYLLNSISITCMKVDSSGRKWFGTNGNGVYLISNDNTEEIYHFTTDNSKLLSDNIESIAINHMTGEVFFGTSKGLCSFLSDAITPAEEMTKDNVYAYPNPVKSDYTGPIKIVGLSYQSDIKIVNVNGVLVAEGKSNGGLFTWDGCDKNGNRVASGIYMVMAATSEGKKGIVCKIAIIN